ncbi:MAG: acyl-CoA dehydrogenase family protein, partial [Pseudomonadota bacterium]|nr:acyl-CoA dehydrogenase family protein [Pseudomonadota bacterium]
TAAMEVRGANGFNEDWDNARLVRDAHTGVLWEGTSSIVALDVARRAVPQVQAHKALGAAMHGLLDSSDGLPGQFGGELAGMVDRAVAFADEVAREPESEAFSRQATNALYHAMTATLLAHEGAIMAKKTGDARRMLLARLVIDHRMRPHDPMSLDGGRIEREAGALLLRDAPVSLEDAVRVLAS